MPRLASCLLITFSTLQPQVTALEIMQKVEAQSEPSDVISTTVITMTKITKTKERSRSREIKSFQKSFQEGSFVSKSLIRFTKPADVKGTGLLMWEYRKSGKDNDQWLYLPELRKVKRVQVGQNTGRFMGTDFTYEDLAGRSIDEDGYVLLGRETVFGSDCYKLEAFPREEKPSYSKRIIWVDAERWVVRKVEFYDLKGRLLKILTVPEMRKDGQYWTIVKMIMENTQKPHRTTLETVQIEYDGGISEDRFLVTSLKRL